MRVLRIGPSGVGGLTSSCGCDIAATKEEIETVIFAVNSHADALALARAVAKEQSRYTIGKMARKLLRMEGEKI